MKDRAPDWEREEKEFLLEEVSSISAIIENMNDDVEASKKNNAAWDEIKKLNEAKFGAWEKKRFKKQYQYTHTKFF